MRKTTFIILLLTSPLVLTHCSYDKDTRSIASGYEGFMLSYVFSGLGSNMGTKQPKLTIKGNAYIYQSCINSGYKQGDKIKCDDISSGKISLSSLDSIIEIVNALKDSTIFKINTSIMSGGVHSLSIENNSKQVKYTLHNESDSSALKIIRIINSNLPTSAPKLWLFERN